jgi:hypothetical protein
MLSCFETSPNSVLMRCRMFRAGVVIATMKQTMSTTLDNQLERCVYLLRLPTLVWYSYRGHVLTSMVG